MKLKVKRKPVEFYKIIGKIVYEDLKLAFNLRSKLADAAQSIAINIAEGYSRCSIKAFIRFLYILLSSLSENVFRIISLRVTDRTSNEQFNGIDLLYNEIENRLLRLDEILEWKRDDGTRMDCYSHDIAEYYQ